MGALTRFCHRKWRASTEVTVRELFWAVVPVFSLLRVTVCKILVDMARVHALVSYVEYGRVR